MKFTTRWMPVAATASAATILFAASSLSPESTGLTVHEWGTFTSVAAEDGSAARWDALGCKDDLPAFVNDFGFRNFKARLDGTVRMETPVLYFYSARELEAQVTVRFPHGVITEWYPNGEPAIYESKSLIDRMPLAYDRSAIYPAASLTYAPPLDLDPSLVKLDRTLNGMDFSMRQVLGSIEWQNVKVQPNTSPALPTENKPGRYYAARATDAAPLEVGDQQEKFLFYRGVARIPVPLSARILPGDAIQVEPRGEDEVSHVFLFENRGGHLGYRNAGAITGSATLVRPELNGSFAQLRNDLAAALVADGLFPKEAQAMIDTWRDSWFEVGSRIIYILPTKTVDAILPLQIDPAPSQLERVFVGRIELITPETQQAVRDAISTTEKSDLWGVLDPYSRFLGPILERMYPEDAQARAVVEDAFHKVANGRESCQ
jgi:hypothetical protein